ncbi:pyrimidine reductase family protein [Corynebacterium endometrii]|uniref:5-amino-6-(5-phosphoribosylamino)uracil reductase n=1 Tax=Corynebacterium endometrii TaxID=2488819 RepID=A0A4P7QID7_9CORY|nr:pyrimidine reductase family protein [Corynebacterium endometrii]QCB28567.1 5-amino-6-(5-phosphoribosylamino)uracil reductase [Corynebacterium endometrii]
MNSPSHNEDLQAPSQRQEPQIKELIGPSSPAGQPWVRMVAVTTVHGSATLEGNSGAIGNDLDSQLLAGLRDWADAVLVGSATVKAEGYGGIPATASRPSPAPFAVLSSSLDLDPTSRFFTQAVTPPLIVTPTSSLDDPALDSTRRALDAAGARLVDGGDGSVESAIRALNDLGYAKVSCEGGPRVYSGALSSGLLNQLYLTVDPHVSPLVEKTLVPQREPGQPNQVQRLELEHCAVSADSTVFLRYGVARTH